VIDADVSSSADLVHTLRAYYAHDARMNATAAAIHAHRHTISYRLGRIAELTGHDPQTPGGQSQLTLGLQALALRHAPSATST
jgi:DNA-binding PucR family transcriptional regulator